MNIRPLKTQQHAELVQLIRCANTPIAAELGLTPENAKSHTAFFTLQHLQRDINKDNHFYIAEQQGRLCGCIALRKADAKVWYINRLATLPEHQGKGIGTALLKFCFDKVQQQQGTLIRAGVISEQTSLIEWYLQRGFEKGKTKQFARLPFRISYLSAHLKTQANGSTFNP